MTNPPCKGLKGIPAHDLCANCEIDCSMVGDCYNCAHRSEFSSYPSGFGKGHDCSKCHKVIMMRVGAGLITPSRWIWDEGYCVSEIGELIFLCHSTSTHKKRIAVKYLREAFEREQKGEKPLKNEEIKKIITDVNCMR